MMTRYDAPAFAKDLLELSVLHDMLSQVVREPF